MFTCSYFIDRDSAHHLKEVVTKLTVGGVEIMMTMMLVDIVAGQELSQEVPLEGVVLTEGKVPTEEGRIGGKVLTEGGTVPTEETVL